MLGLLGTLLSLIPGLSNLASQVLQSKFDKDVKLYSAKAGVAKDVAVEAIRAQAQVQTKWWFVALIPALWGSIFLAYDAKIVVWDKMFGWGVTDPLDPNMWYVHLAVVTGFFGQVITERILNKG